MWGRFWRTLGRRISLIFIVVDLWLPAYVFDNNSTDATAAVAKKHGAIVSNVALRGKGNVIRRMFADVEADVYVMVDGDATYDTAQLPVHVDLLLAQQLDMVVGCRVDDGLNPQTYRPGHRWGNVALTRSVSSIFGGQFTDMLSGYRVFSRRYVKSFPAMSKGFEIETELTVHALELRMPWAEVSTVYRARPEGSESKLSTYRDGWRILRTIGRLFINERPLQIFGIAFVVLLLLSLGLTVPLILTYLDTGLVPRFPTLPTLKESGLDHFIDSPYGVAGPKGMDAARVAQLTAVFQKALLSPAGMKAMELLNQQPNYKDPAQYQRYAQEAFAREKQRVAWLRDQGLL